MATGPTILASGKPPLDKPSFDGYTFPEPEAFFKPEWKEAAWKRCDKYKDSFLIGHLGWGLFERSWNLRGFENALVDAATQPDFYEEMSIGGGYILAPAKELQPETPIENAKAIVEAFTGS